MFVARFAWVVVLAVSALCIAAEPAKKPTLAAELAKLKVPPEWFDSTAIHWDMNKPWKDGRIEIRRLLALGDEQNVREAVKLTILYAQKNDINDGHELPMYLFLSGNYAWATIEFPKFLAKVQGKGATHAYLCYASCLSHFGEYDKALQVLDRAMKDLPAAPWTIHNTANIHNHYGDLYAEMGQADKAKEHYAEAIRLYPTSNQPYGRQLLPRRVAQVNTKLNLLVMQALADIKLRDGAFPGRSLGYSDKKDSVVNVRIASGKIADVQVQHEEKIDLNATKIIPQRIIEKQSLTVDAITGATVTSQAIIDGTFQALKKAGLQ